jgi:hypothetical protein
MKRLLKKFLLWLMDTAFYSWFMYEVFPKIRFTTKYTRFSGHKFLMGYKILRPGQFILALDEDKASVLVPGFMSHAGYVVNNAITGDPYSFEIGEMTARGFTFSTWFDICHEASRVLICDCLDWDLNHKHKMLQAVSLFYYSEYDLKFTLGVSALYCSELVYQLDKEAGGKLLVDLSDIESIGRKYISPDGLLFGKNVKVVWDSDGELDNMSGPEAEEFCRSRGYIK